jgi:hypothetical protein
MNTRPGRPRFLGADTNSRGFHETFFILAFARDLPRAHRAQPQGHRVGRRKESIRQPGVAVIECKEIDCLDLCRHDTSGSQRLRSALIENIETRLVRRLEGDGRRAD